MGAVAKLVGAPFRKLGLPAPITPFDDLKRDVGLLKKPKAGDTRSPSQRFIESTPGPIAGLFGSTKNNDRKTILGR